MTPAPSRPRPRPRGLRGFGLAVVVALAVALGVWGFGPTSSPAPRPLPTRVEAVDATTVQRTTTEPALVFQRAFWRRPAADDRILGAERREIHPVGDHAVAAWAWFLAVQPGSGLRDWLQTNPFGLVTASTQPPPADAAPLPTWFPTDFTGFTMQRNAEGRFTLWYSAEQNLLFAHDSGFGFAGPQREP